VGDPVVGRPAYGLALVLRSGLPAWLAQLQRPTATGADLPGRRRGDAPPAEAPVGHTATATILILASMVLAAHEERSDDRFP
jgi:hypothetical protein